MHFWIDKRSQGGYSGRHRVPSSLSAGVGIGVGRSRGRVCAAGRKGMAAPVHRFAPVDCAPRRPRPMRHYVPPPMPPVHTSRRQNQEPSVYVEIPPGPPQPTIASLAAARSVTPDTLLRTAALGLHHSPMMAPHLKFGMLVSFALATMFLTGAKYYFDRQVMKAGGHSGYASSGEAGVVCATVACVCGVGCALTMCRTRAAPPPAPPDRVSSTARRRPASPSPARTATGPVQREVQEPEDISLIPLTRDEGAVGGASGSESPPPYHIAVLLPPPSPPPPAYSALS